MGLFGQSSSFDVDVEKATSDINTNENWSLILDVCDKVSTHPRLAKDCLKAVMRRMGHNDPHVVMQAITLLDALSNNCGKPFRLEVASREFETEFRRLLAKFKKSHPKVAMSMCQVLKNWAENDFKGDPQLTLIPSLFLKLRLDGYDFRNLNEKIAGKAPVEKAVSLSKDPNVVNSQQEEDDIAKAIELSLKDNKSPASGSSPKVTATTSQSTTGNSTYPSLYPSFGSATSTTDAAQASAAAPEPRKVRALYDFEAAEENELTFFAGEIIHVMDDTDPNWWKGFNQRGEGLFPSNFVTADLSVDPERLDINQQHKTAATGADEAQKTETNAGATAGATSVQPVEIDEAKVDRLLHLLHEANPEDPSQDTNEMLRLEQEVHQMGPLIDAELERVDRKHAQLTQLSSDLVDAINLYHTLMRDDRAAAGQFAAGGFMPGLPANFPGAALYGAPGYPSAVGFPPAQSYPGMHSLPYGPVSVPSVTQTAGPAPAQAPAVYLGQQGQIPLPYQNGHALPPQAAGPPGHGQSIYNANQTNPQQQAIPQQQQPQPGYHLDQQQQQQQHPTQFAAVPPAATQLPPHQQHQHQQQQPHSYMSPQHQQHPQAPPQGYQPVPPQPQQQQQQPSAVPQAQNYAPNGPPPTATIAAPPPAPGVNPQNYMPQISHAPHPQHQPFSQLHQQIMVGGGVGGPPPTVAPGYPMQNDTVITNNIPIYQQQR
ncbi:signal transducing adapter molecule 1 [Drosophila willistoni]|uniref:signal transducing adapter molecule 1 n=1 Tax=Drosophila willistoni TaxID=7260 RepID=UPI001F086FFD|nr:signal transducing adapter molecule 1 [Drosophila willistoni]